MDDVFIYGLCTTWKLKSEFWKPKSEFCQKNFVLWFITVSENMLCFNKLQKCFNFSV